MPIEIDHIYRVNKTLLEMFKDRGGEIEDNLFTSGLSLENFRILAKSFNSIEKNLSPFNFIVDGKEVHFICFKKKVNKKFIEDSIVKQSKVDKYIRKNEGISMLVIFNEELQDGMPLNLLDIEIFHYKELLYNPSHHDLVPKHEIIDRDDCPYSDNELPVIDVNDVMARYLNMTPGQICKITRTNTSCGTSIYYRICRFI